jgi:hypothetical protein
MTVLAKKAARKAYNLLYNRLNPIIVKAGWNKPILTKEQVAFYHEEGYLPLVGFFSPEEINQVNAIVDEAWAKDAEKENPLVLDILTGDLKGQRVYMRDMDPSVRNEVYKLNDLFLTSDFVKSIVLNARLRKALDQLMGSEPLICNSLNFERGSQQPYHIDSWYMPAPVDDKLAAVFVSLDEIGDENGPFTYYPKSHKIPPYYFSHGRLSAIQEEMDDCFAYINGEVEKRGLKPEFFNCKPGDVFIWHSQLYHGGAPIKNRDITRKSIVTHYWRVEDAKSEKIAEANSGGYYIDRGHQKVANS